MSGPIRLDPERISILDSNVFTRLCNDLLRAEADRRGIPQVQVDTTVRDKAPDGGVDCLVTGAPTPEGPWIPQNGSAYQLKSGAAPGPAELAREVQKPEAQAAFIRGDAYVLVLAEPISGPRKRSRLDVINSEYTRRGLFPRGKVWAADKVAAWVEQHPAIAASTFGLPLPGWLSFEEWALQAPFRTPWSPSPAQADIVRQIGTAIRSGTQYLQVEGRPGAGKTRTVLEALRPNGLRQRVLYTPEPAVVKPDFSWYLRNQNAQGTGLFVVDQCTPDDFARIRGILDPLPPGFALIGIGSPQPAAHGGGAIRVPDFDEDFLVSLLGFLSPPIPYATLRAVAERCGGSPKLAVLVGTHLADAPSGAEWDQVERSPDIARYLNTIFPLDRQDPQGIVVRAVSLFGRLGWQDEAAAEGEAVVEFLGLAWSQAQLAAQRLVDDGVLSRRGRYLQVTPDVLANHLARDTLGAYGTSIVPGLFSRLPDPARRSFVERLRLVGDRRETRPVVEEILERAGFFAGLPALEDAWVARLALELAAAFAETVGGHLHRTIGAAGRDALLGLDGQRQKIVWALEQLTWQEDRFAMAARLLLRLAWAENSTLHGGATDAWTSLFQVLPSGTSLPFLRRLPVLDEALAAEEADIRRLGVQALGVALRHQMIPLHFPPLNTGILPPSLWAPKGLEEHGEILCLCLHRLGDALDDPDEPVRRSAVEVAALCGRELIANGHAVPWADAVRRLRGRPFEAQAPVLSVVEEALRFAPGPGTADVDVLKALREELRDGSFSDRLRYALAYGADTAAPVPTASAGERPLDVLAREAVAHMPLLEDALGWLLDEDTAGVSEFGKAVGARDDGDALVLQLAARYRAGARGAAFLSGYLAGAVGRHGPEWLERLLDGWAAEPEMGPCVASVTARLLSSDRAARRVTTLVADGSLPGSVAERLADESWGGGVSGQCLAELLDAVAPDPSPQAIRGRVLLLLQQLQANPERLPTLRVAVEHALEAGASMSHRRQLADPWVLLARVILSDAPVEVARMCLTALEANVESLAWLSSDADPRRFLREVLRSGPREVFREVIGPALVRDPALPRELTSGFSGRSLLRELEPQMVLDWVEEDPDTRLSPVSAAVPVVAWNDEEAEGYPNSRLSPLARALLARFGHLPAVRDALSQTLWDIIDIEPRSQLVNEWLRVFATWSEDSEPNLREWTLTLTTTYRRYLKHLQAREEEGGW